MTASSAQIRASIESLDADIAAASSRLLEAQNENRASLEAGIVAVALGEGNPFTPTSDLAVSPEIGLAAARLNELREIRSTATRLLDNAIQREKAEAEDAARAEIQAVFDLLKRKAADADAAVLNAINDLREMASLAEKARKIAREKLNVNAIPLQPAGAAAPLLANLLRDACHWTPRDFQTHAAEQTGSFVRMISDETGIDRQ